MRIRKIVNTIISTLILIVFLVLITAVVISKASGGEPSFFGYQIKTVLSGSMEPGIQTGSIVAIKPGGDMTRFQKGDVITFLNPDNILITHRVVDAELNSALGKPATPPRATIMIQPTPQPSVPRMWSVSTPA